MPEQANFNYLVERAMQGPGRGHMRPVIAKELLHYDILFRLDKEGLLDQLTFQGGTSLRLCHGSARFSEDLDFVGGRHFASQQLHQMKECIEDYIGKRYGLEVRVKEPAELRQDPEYATLKVDKWQISVVTSPERKDLPMQRVKVEVANIPAYSREPRPLQVNYDFLPDGYGDTLIMTETLNEVMADKLVSLVNTQRYVRHRDIWDLRWLKQKGATIVPDWIDAKISDYRIDDYLGKLDETWQRLPEIIHGQRFREEMSRFIPRDVQERTLDKAKFLDFLVSETGSMLHEVKHELSREESDDEFTI
jgi:hypothetical protein